MDGRKANGPGAAATALRAEIVVSSKPTQPDTSTGKHRQSLAEAVGRTGNRPSLRSAIDAKCKSCIYDPGSGNGTWREQVQACSSANCPLHAVRPFALKAKLSGENLIQAAKGIKHPRSSENDAVAEKLALNGSTTEHRDAA